MSDDHADRFRRTAATFTDRVRQVPADAWENPAPCEGWVTRDVVRHLVDWVPGFLGSVGLELPAGPSVDDDPEGAWTRLAEGIQGILDDPEQSGRTIDSPQFGTIALGQMLDMIVTGDVLVHTWDLSRAAGIDESIDEDMAAGMLAGMEPMDEVLRGEHFGPKVDVPADADVVTRLIAFTGRTP